MGSKGFRVEVLGLSGLGQFCLGSMEVLEDLCQGSCKDLGLPSGSMFLLLCWCYPRKLHRKEKTAHVVVYGAASPRRRPPKPGLSSQQAVARDPRNSPPSQASRLSKQGAGGITHNTWNHKTGNHRSGVGKDNPQQREPQGPFPFPSPSTQMRMMAMMLCPMTLMCYSQCGCWASAPHVHCFI